LDVVVDSRYLSSSLMVSAMVDSCSELLGCKRLIGALG
jgi:hypothetical protein